jgi:HWE histidine kinase
MLATVEAVVHLTKAGTVEGFKEAVSGRIRALANVHRLFVETRWQGAEVRSIATEELSAYTQGNDARIQISGPMILLEPSAAQAMAACMNSRPTQRSTGPCRCRTGGFTSNGHPIASAPLFSTGLRQAGRTSSFRRAEASAKGHGNHDPEPAQGWPTFRLASPGTGLRNK